MGKYASKTSVPVKNSQDEINRILHPKSAPPGSGIRANESFSSAVKDVVSFRNKRSVWRIATQPYSGAHFATFPEKLVEPCILAGSREGDVVLDPFVGSGTTVRVAKKFNRVGIGGDLAYQDIASIRTRNVQRRMAGI